MTWLSFRWVFAPVMPRQDASHRLTLSNLGRYADNIGLAMLRSIGARTHYLVMPGLTFAHSDSTVPWAVWERLNRT
jgi:hypothetical protein